jgi:hypothetical protein
MVVYLLSAVGVALLGCRIFEMSMTSGNENVIVCSTSNGGGSADIWSRNDLLFRSCKSGFIGSGYSRENASYVIRVRTGIVGRV